MNSKDKKPRTYRRITPETVAIHKAAVFIEGNNTAATRKLEPEYVSPEQRSYRIVKKSEDMPTLEYIENSFQQIGAEAVQELGELIHSKDERIKGVNVRYAIDQLRGKAVTKSVSLVGKVNIQSVLD